MTNKTFHISGRVIAQMTNQSTAGLRVEAWDKDLIIDDLVDSAVTETDGSFQLLFEESYFRELFIDRQPDLYFKVYNQEELIKSTEDSVVWNVKKQNSQVVIELDEAPKIVGLPTVERTASLPQNDSPIIRAEREVQLLATREIYNYKQVDDLPMPLASNSAAIAQIVTLKDWVKGQVENQLRIFVNLKIWEILSRYQKSDATIEDHASKITEIFNSSRYKELASNIEIREDSLSTLEELGDRMTRVDIEETYDFPNFASYAKVFNLYKVPDITGLWQDDKTFASQRLAGLNPMTMKRVTLDETIGANWDELQKKLSPDITEAAVKYFLGTDSSFISAINEHRLFVCDYEALTKVKADKNAPGVQKGQYLMGPIALFVRTDDFPGLQLAAVQINQSPTVGERNHYPSMLAADATKPGNANKWIMMKMFIQAADLNFNQAVNHLGETHLTEEAFAIATHRQLALQHPLHILLSYHFTALIVINKLGQLELLNADGIIQQILEGGLSGSLELIQNAYDEWEFDNFDFPAQTAARGLDTNSLSYFPYRDDGQLIWDTLGDYVTEYIGLYYKTDQDVTKDYELQNWAREIASKNHGHIKGFNSSISSIDQLCTIIHRLIWTAGPQHAAVNFPQVDYAAFIPNMPAATYDKIKDPVDTADVLALLPPAKQTKVQVNTTYVLAGYYYDQLLDYYSKLAPEPSSVCKKYYDKLNGEIKQKIERRNQNREAQQGLLPYNFFLPSNIPNSTSV